MGGRVGERAEPHCGRGETEAILEHRGSGSVSGRAGELAADVQRKPGMTVRSEAQSQAQDGRDAAFISQLCGGENHSLGNERGDERWPCWDHPAAQPASCSPRTAVGQDRRCGCRAPLRPPIQEILSQLSPLHLPTGAELLTVSTWHLSLSLPSLQFRGAWVVRGENGGCLVVLSVA